jgi:DNA-binding transcriptional MocR family regulator
MKAAPTDVIKARVSRENHRARYLEIVEAITSAIEMQELRPGQRLPTQRLLAQALGVALGTVTRAYTEAERRSLVTAVVGRGTFVTARGVPERPIPRREEIEAPIDLTVNRVLCEELRIHFENTLTRMAKRVDLVNLFGYQRSAGPIEHRAAGASWIARTGLTVEANQVVLCNGVQHGLVVVFGALGNPGDMVVTEELNYPGVRLLESICRLRFRPVPVDEEGLLPDALALACKDGQAKFLLCTPTIHNPTGTMMSSERRRLIAEVASKYGLTVVENGIYGRLPREEVLPLCSYLPAQSLYVTSVSKTVGPGVRFGYIVAPHNAIEKLVTAVQATTWMPSPLIGEIVSTWINEGTAEQILEWHRCEASRRQEVAKRILSDFQYQAHPLSYHIWLHVPEPWRHYEFVRQAANAKVLITPAETFVIGRGMPPHAVRISLAGVRHLASLERGLQLLANILRSGPALQEVRV